MDLSLAATSLSRAAYYQTPSFNTMNFSSGKVIFATRVKVTAYVAGNFHFFFGFGDSVSSSSRDAVYVEWINLASTSSRFRCISINNFSTGVINETTPTAPVLNTWYTLVAEIDVSVPSIKFYINGTLAGENTNIGTMPTASDRLSTFFEGGS